MLQTVAILATLFVCGPILAGPPVKAVKSKPAAAVEEWTEKAPAAPAKPQAAPAKPEKQYSPEELRAEVEFLAGQDTPKLFPMREALRVSAHTGKPVFCWMGEHVFADENARRLSQELKSDTVQAMMDTDPDSPRYDALNPRVKFNSAQYTNGGKTYTIPTGDFKFEGPGVAKEETTAYKLRVMIETKAQPAGRDALEARR